MWKKIPILKILFTSVATIFVAGAVFWFVDSSPQYPPILITKSKNGHDFWFMPIDGTDQTAISVVWETDLAGLPEGMERGAKIGARLIQNGGAGKFGAKEIATQLDKLNAGFHLNVLPQRIEGMFLASGQSAVRAAEIVGLKLAKPKLETPIFEELKFLEISNNLNATKSNNQIAWQTARAMMFKGHPYQQFWSQIDNNGLSDLSLDHIREWQRLSFSREPTHIVAVSGASRDEVSIILDKLLPEPNVLGFRLKMKKRISALNIPVKTILVHAPKSKNTHLLIFGSVPPAGGPRHLEMALANGIIAWGSNSRLLKQLPEDWDEQFHISGGYEEYTDEHRIFWIGGEIGKNQLAGQLVKIENTYKDFLKNGISRLEFIVAKRSMRKFIDNEFTNPLKTTAKMLKAKRLGAGPKYIPKASITIANMNRTHTNEIIQEDFPKFDEMMRIIVSPDRNVIEADCVIISHLEIEKCF